MSLTPDEKLECKEIAREIVKEVLIQHIDACPHGKSLWRYICLSVGIALGSGVASGSVVAAMIKLLGA